MEAFIKGISAIIAVVALIFVFCILLAYPIMWTWNYTFPAVFGVPEINVWQALWGSVCIRLIFPSGSSTSSK